MAKDNTTISVIMPAWNSAKYIEPAIQSILDQSHKDIELIVVNDGSQDETAAVIKRLAANDSRVKAFDNPKNIGQTRSRNFGISKAKGKFMAFMDADDLRHPDSMRKQLEFLQKHPDIVMVGTAAEICDEQMNRLNDRIYPLENDEIRKTFFRYSPFCLASIMVRAEALEAEAYKPAMEPAEDIDLTLRLGKVGPLANLPDIFYKVRTHKHSVTQRGARMMEKKTLYLRIKAVFEYGYTMSFSDKLYFLAQMTTMYIMPPRFRFWLFNKLRSSK